MQTKCDRCNSTYDNTKHKQYIIGVLTLNEEQGNVYSLCPKCAKSLINFVYKKENENADS